MKRSDSAKVALAASQLNIARSLGCPQGLAWLFPGLATKKKPAPPKAS